MSGIRSFGVELLQPRIQHGRALYGHSLWYFYGIDHYNLLWDSETSIIILLKYIVLKHHYSPQPSSSSSSIARSSSLP